MFLNMFNDLENDVTHTHRLAVVGSGSECADACGSRTPSPSTTAHKECRNRFCAILIDNSSCDFSVHWALVPADTGGEVENETEANTRDDARYADQTSNGEGIEGKRQGVM